MKNPVFMREINTMFRSYKTFVSIGIYAVALLAVTALYLFNVVFYSYNGYNPKSVVYMFCLMIAFQTSVIFLSVPGSSAGSVSGERERQTLDLMLISKMKPFTIVTGKLLSSLLFIFIMIIASMPAYAVVFYFGGISVFDLFFAFAFDFSYAMLIGSLSILYSCLFKRNVTATVISYLTLIFFPVILFIIMALLSANHISGTIMYVLLCLNPFTAFISFINTVLGQNSLYMLFSSTSDNMADFAVKIWQMTIAVNIIMTFVFLRLSSFVINPLRKNN